MRARVVLVILILSLAGCVQQGRDFAIAPIRSIQPNVTTQREVFHYFGEPLRRGLENGLETWTYSYQYYELAQLRDFRELHIVFNTDNTVRSYSFTGR
jgi:hypothetical protein